MYRQRTERRAKARRNTEHCGERMPGTKKLSLDQYLSFVNSDGLTDLTVDLLNQVIDMHGFKKIHKTRKKIVIDAVSLIDLMNPSRSTLKDENVSSCAFMTLEDTINDLADLNWQECSVTSIQTLNSVNYDLDLLRSNDSFPKSKSKKSRTTRKRRKLLSLANIGGYGAATAGSRGCGHTEGSQSACSAAAVGGDSGRMAKLVPKRNNTRKDDGGGGGESFSSFVAIAPY